MTGTRTRRRAVVFQVLLLSSFGPYVSSSIRTEQLLIYTLLLWTILEALTLTTISRKRVLMIVGALLLAALLWSLLVALLRRELVGASRIVAAFENLFQSLATIVVVGSLMRGLSREDARQHFATTVDTFATLLSLNTCVVLAGLMVDTQPLLQLFLPALDADGSAVWARSVASGRFTGIFGQPLEAGTAYSIAALGLAVHSDRRRARRITLGAIVFLGGVLSTSKVFLLGGLPLSIALLLVRNRRRIAGALAVTVLLAMGGVGAVLGLAQAWSGADRLLQLFALSRADGLMDTLSGRRFGGNGSVQRIVAPVFQERAAFEGLGLGGSIVYDSAYLEFFVQGGLVALLLYIGTLVVLTTYSLRLERGSRSRQFLVSLSLFTWLAGLGAPIITQNRVSVAFWMLVVIAFEARHASAVVVPRSVYRPASNSDRALPVRSEA